jgi:nicotinamidase-related amidase
MRYVLMINDLQTKVVPHIIGCDQIINNVNRLIHSTVYCNNIVDIYLAELKPEKLGKTISQIEVPCHIDIINKKDYSMIDGNILKHLKGNQIKNVILTGVETPWCIMVSTQKLIANGFNVHIPIDAVGSQNSFENKIALQRLQNFGAYICTTRGILSEMISIDNNEFLKWYIKEYKD